MGFKQQNMMIEWDFSYLTKKNMYFMEFKQETMGIES
jgi:hypothetical protein